MLLANLSLSLLLFLILSFVCFIFGSLFLEYNIKFKSERILNATTYLKPIIGYSVLLILTYYLYFNLNIKIYFISLFFLLSSIFIFIISNKKNEILKEYFKILFLTLPIFFIFLVYGLLAGEQFYIFRGNYWDNMNYISTAILMNEMNIKEIYNIKNNFIDETKAVIYNGSKNIFFRPLISAILGQLFQFKIIGFFFINYFFKIFLASQIFLSFYFLLNQINIKYKYLISFVFIFSFWSLYTFETDALSQLGSSAIFICAISILIFEKKSLFSDYLNFNLFLLFSVALFFVYPEKFLVSGFLIVLFFLFQKNLLNFLKSEKKKILIGIIVFLFLTLPTFETNYATLYNQIRFASIGSVDWWGYYGLFLTGNFIEILDQEHIQTIKKIVAENNNFLFTFKFLKDYFIENSFYIVPFNLIPSFFGMYFLTVSNLDNIQNIILFMLTIVLNFYLIYIFFKNLRHYLNNRNNLSLLFITSITGFIFLVLFFILRGSYWPIIKLYSFLGPIIFLFLVIKVKDSLDAKYSINYIILLILIIFPLYKYSNINSGITRYDTFPSIINPNYKKLIIWELDAEIHKCKEISYSFSDRIINGYISIKLYDLGFSYIDGNKMINKNSKFTDKINNCEIKIKNKRFKVIYEN